MRQNYTWLEHGWCKSAAESGGSRAGAYVLGTINTNSCPAGSSFITAAAQCQAAATALGLRDGGSTIYAFQPRGCARSASTSGVEYNSHASGAADPDYTPICAAAGARGCRYAVFSILAAPTRGQLARPCVGMACSVHLPCVLQMQARWPPRRRIVRSPLPSDPALHAPISSA